MRNEIKNLGIEIEGAWDDCSRVVPWLKDDGSVRVEGYTSVGQDVSRHFKSLSETDRPTLLASYVNRSHSGEIASHLFNSKGQIEDWLKKTYPNKSNSTCGIHIHVSFFDLNSYASLMTKSFYEMFLCSLHEFGENEANESDIFWNRLGGGNRFCERIFNP